MAVVLYFFMLLLVTTIATQVIVRAGPVPNAVSLALGGLFAASLLGFLFGGFLGRPGVVATVWGSSVLAAALFVFTLATAPSFASFVILSALGFWSVPFFGVAASFCGLSMRALHPEAEPN